MYYAYLARARRNPQLGEVADNVDAALLRLCQQVVAALAPDMDSDGCECRARELHALTEGLAFALVTWPEGRSATDTRHVLRGWLRRLADEHAKA